MTVFNKKGFSLLEMVVVVAILAIVTTVSFSAFKTSRTHSEDARRKADIAKVQAALEGFRADDINGSYPSVATYSALRALLVPVYLPEMPSDPSLSKTYEYTPKSCSIYRGSTICSDYKLSATLESKSKYSMNKDGQVADIQIDL